MKHIIIFFTLCCGLALNAQNHMDFQFSVSNQGQTDKVMNDFYYLGHETAYQDDATNGRDIFLKYNLTFTYSLWDSLDCRIRLGYGHRKGFYRKDIVPFSTTVQDEQHLFEITPSFGYNKKWKIVRLGTGFELPFYIAGKFSQVIEAEDTQMNYHQRQFIRLNGGIIVGLNHYVNLKLFFLKKVYAFSEVNYGLMYGSLGRKYSSDLQNIDGTPLYSEEFDKTYKKIFFSGIHVQMGIGIRL